MKIEDLLKKKENIAPIVMTNNQTQKNGEKEIKTRKKNAVIEKEGTKKKNLKMKMKNLNQ